MLRSTKPEISVSMPDMVVLPPAHEHLRGRAKELRGIILEGTMLCVDPSSGSRQSLPGWAVYRAGSLRDYGIVEVPSNWLNKGSGIPYRLKYIADAFRNAWPGVEYDLLAMEDVKLDNEKGTLQNAIESLMLAKGAITAALSWKEYIGVHALAWHSIKPPGYEKSDTSDAVLIGELLIRLAREMS